jgi:hypothetical protein
MNKDQGWIVCAANDKIDMVRTIRDVTAPGLCINLCCFILRQLLPSSPFISTVPECPYRGAPRGLGSCLGRHAS